MNKFSQALKIGKQQENQKTLTFEWFSVQQGRELLNVLNQQTKPLLPGDIDAQEQQKIIDEIVDIEAILDDSDVSLYEWLIEKYGVVDILLFIENRLQWYWGVNWSIQIYKLRYCLINKWINILLYAKPVLERSIIKTLLLDMHTFPSMIISSVPFNDGMIKRVVAIAYEMDEWGWIDENDPLVAYNLIMKLKEVHHKEFSPILYLQIFDAWKNQYKFLISEYNYNLESAFHLKEMMKIQQNFLATNPESIARIAQEKEKYRDQSRYWEVFDI